MVLRYIVDGYTLSYLSYGLLEAVNTTSVHLHKDAWVPTV